MPEHARHADDVHEMKEMLFTGRGGEGVVLASQILADTFARAGFYVQSFPEFKAERRGAPISAFLRWDERPIRRRYKIRDCDVLVVSHATEQFRQAVRQRPRSVHVLDLARLFKELPVDRNYQGIAW